MIADRSLMKLLGLPSRKEMDEAKKLRDAKQEEAKRATEEFARMFSEVATVLRMRGNGNRQRNDH